MPRTLFPRLALLLGLVLVLAGCSVTQVLRVENREIIGVETMIEELRPAKVVFLGERHDASSHHRLQLEVIKGLKAKGRPVAIGMEMFEDSSQGALDAWIAGKAPESAIRKVFEDNWRNMSWGLYRDIVLYARENRIPLIALNAPRALVQKVSRTGFSSLSQEDLNRLPPGTNAEVDDAYLDFMAGAYGGHGRSGSAFRYICEAQMLRNRVMARRIGYYLARHSKMTLVVIAGGGHARETGGVPAELAGISYRIVLPPVPGLTAETVTVRDGHYLLEEPFSWLEQIF